jgi:HTH-type transcriptional regulator/antitoxin HigA
MAEKTTGLSRELIIHPGETLNDILKDRGVSQLELSYRTGVTDAYVSKVINGVKDISVSFAKKLEYALGIESSFWINLQANYDCEKAEFEEENNITNSEFDVLNELKDIVMYIQKIGLIEKTPNKACQVLELRKFFCISNLFDIPKLALGGIFRKSQSSTVNLYVLFAWLRLCQIQASKISLTEKLNIQRLKDSIPKIKLMMFNNNFQNDLQKLFSDCGIAFSIVKNFTGAPVQGYIKNNFDSTLTLSMTIRGAFADIFWFTLFHEIGHIINNDIGVTKSFIDYNSSVDSDFIEKKADEFAKNILIDPLIYGQFLKRNDYSLEAINCFAYTQNVPNYIVIGRLQKDNVIPYKLYSNQKARFIWAD